MGCTRTQMDREDVVRHGIRLLLGPHRESGILDVINLEDHRVVPVQQCLLTIGDFALVAYQPRHRSGDRARKKKENQQKNNCGNGSSFHIGSPFGWVTSKGTQADGSNGMQQ